MRLVVPGSGGGCSLSRAAPSSVAQLQAVFPANELPCLGAAIVSCPAHTCEGMGALIIERKVMLSCDEVSTRQLTRSERSGLRQTQQMLLIYLQRWNTGQVRKDQRTT